MELPKNLASRYSKMTPDEMQGSGAAKDLVRAGMLKSGGRPGAIDVSDQNITKAVLRPGVIDWDPKTSTGVWFDMRKAGMKPGVPSVANLNLDKILHSRYVMQQVKQGADVEEFPDVPVVKETPLSNGKAQAVADKVATAKEAAEVEGKAKALAEKAKATKEAALAGLGWLGDQAAVDAAAKELANAQAAAFAPTCRQGTAVLPAHICDPSLMTRFAEAQQSLAAAAKAAGDEKAAAQAAEAATKIEGGNTKMIVIAVAAALGAVVIYHLLTRG